MKNTKIDVADINVKIVIAYSLLLAVFLLMYLAFLK